MHTCIDNESFFGGGAAVEESSELTLEDTRFLGNTAHQVGGAISCRNASLCVVNGSFVQNGTPGQTGSGAIFGFGGALAIDRCLFSANTGIFGAVTGTSTLRLSNSIFTANHSSGAGGGAVLYNGDDGAIAGCVFVANTAASGGGVLVTEGADASITNCTFLANQPGGLMSDGSCTGARVSNCVFWDNTPYQIQGTDGPDIADVFFSDVQGGYSGSGSNNIDVDPQFTGGQAGTWTDQAVFDLDTWVTTYFDATAAFAPGELAGKVLTPLVGLDEVFVIDDNTATSISIEADFAFFGLPGGSYDIKDVHLTPASSCIDAGHNWHVAPDFADVDGDGDSSELTPIDLDGNPRFAADGNDFDPGCGVPVVVDMGAYEYRGDPFPVKYGDIDGDGEIGIEDFLIVLGTWGACDPGCCLADLDSDGQVGVVEFLLVLGDWG